MNLSLTHESELVTLLKGALADDNQELLGHIRTEINQRIRFDLFDNFTAYHQLLSLLN